MGPDSSSTTSSGRDRELAIQEEIDTTQGVAIDEGTRCPGALNRGPSFFPAVGPNTSSTIWSRDTKLLRSMEIGHLFQREFTPCDEVKAWEPRSLGAIIFPKSFPRWTGSIFFPP